MSKQSILKKVSGSAMPGQATYILGSSGAGKTSLLNLISDRIGTKQGQHVSGQVLLNDKTQLTQQVFGNVGAYVMQDDILYSYFTVEEAFMFAAKLKLNCSLGQQKNRVRKLMEELGLRDIRTTLIGDSQKKFISGGERKRTAIGVELITDPQLILLDEPTSGLDSFRAFSIVKFLKRQAQKGKTVLATIHQPSSEAYAAFDKVILMCDGHIVFSGEPHKVKEHFEGLYEFPRFCNPADVAMKILSVNYPKKEADEQKVKDLVDRYFQQGGSRDQDLAIANKFLLSDVKFEKRFKAPCCLQFKTVCRRNALSIQRNPIVLKARIGQNVILGLVAGAAFFQSNGPELTDF